MVISVVGCLVVGVIAMDMKLMELGLFLLPLTLCTE